MAEIRISVSDSSLIGALNLGTIIGDIETNLNVIESSRSGAAQVAEGLRVMTEALASVKEIDDGARREMLESIDFLASAASKPESSPRGLIRGAVMLLSQLTQVSQDLHSLWVQWVAPIAHFFGIS